MWLTTTLNKTHKPSSHTHTNSIPELHKHKYNLSHTQTNWNYLSKKLTSCPLLIWEDPWAKPIKPFATMFVYNAPTICLDRYQIFNYLFNKELFFRYQEKLIFFYAKENPFFPHQRNLITKPNQNKNVRQFLTNLHRLKFHQTIFIPFALSLLIWKKTLLE